MPYLLPTDPKFNDPFSGYNVTVRYKWTCYKNGTEHKHGWRVMKVRKMQDAVNELNNWNTTAQHVNATITWRYELQ